MVFGIKKIVVLASVFFLFWSCIEAIYAKESPEGEGIFTFIQGEVLVKKTVEEGWTRAGFNMPIYRGYQIKVSLYSRAEITLKDKSVIRLKDNTEVDTSEIISAQMEEAPLSLKLKLGQIWAKVKRTKGIASTFEIATPTVVASVRGTTYRAAVRADNLTMIKVYEGEVSVYKPAPIGDLGMAPGKPQKVGPPMKKIAKPFHKVSKAEWERIVGAMQQIIVNPDGTFSEPTQFSSSDPDEQDEWVIWNQQRDRVLEGK